MTSPPPSETGATAEEIVQTWTRLELAGGPLLIGEVNHLTRLIDAALQAAKRSAHLEDARAGCPFCAGRWDDFEAQPVRVQERWEHHVVDKEHASVFCLRPEVWDALSQLPGGQK
jgi:hypothetical protein